MASTLEAQFGASRAPVWIVRPPCHRSPYSLNVQRSTLALPPFHSMLNPQTMDVRFANGFLEVPEVITWLEHANALHPSIQTKLSYALGLGRLELIPLP